MNKIEKQTPSGRVSRFTRSEIDLLFKTGKAVYKSKEFVILTTPCLSFGRILLITSRKVGNAPERNLLRRQSRAIFYEEKLFELKKNCVVIFKAPAKNLSFDQLKEILIKALHKQLPATSDITPTTPSTKTE